LTDYAVRVEGLSKQYVIGARETQNRTLGEIATAAISAPFRRFRSLSGDVRDEEQIWALKDVGFDIKEGDVVGIIGRNGAGKSTLLKILSRITEPTEGRVTIRGRVASLLEVGTGFHQELTGRENIYLNGAVLGMRRVEIDRKFDAIVEFSGVEKFLDTPVKRYSSGMQVRLAFAVAAHLEPEILLVDEVLAVGDAEFQRKCLSTMGDVARGGRTVLFVSHNLSALNKLCPNSVWIDSGRVREIGPTAELIGRYLQNGADNIDTQVRNFVEDAVKPFQLTSVRVVDSEGESRRVFDCDSTVVIECGYLVRDVVPGLYGYLRVHRSDGTVVMQSDSYDTSPNPLENLDVGRRSFRIEIPARSLAPGEYYVFLNFTSPRSKIGWTVDAPGIVGAFQLDDYASQRGNRREGFFSTRLNWSAGGPAG
jgi:lipopolysaccharide transport system ATP-binding protein